MHVCERRVIIGAVQVRQGFRFRCKVEIGFWALRKDVEQIDHSTEVRIPSPREEAIKGLVALQFADFTDERDLAQRVSIQLTYRLEEFESQSGGTDSTLESGVYEWLCLVKQYSID